MTAALSSVDGLAILLVLLALGAVFVVVVREVPLLGLCACLAFMCFVPPWVGGSFVVFVTPLTAAFLGSILALWSGSGIRLRAFDAVMLLVLGVIAVSFVAGFVTLERAFAAVFGWGVAYLAGRVLGMRVREDVVATVIAVAFGVVALLAILEFVTQHNLFVGLHLGGGAGYARWSGIRWRGGVPRVEGAWGSAIALGGGLAMSVPFVWCSRLRPALKAATLAAVGFAAVVTFSRIGMVSTVLAFVGCLVLLGGAVSPGFRRAAAALFVVGAAVALPLARDVFTAAGSEASNSADYRGDLLSLVPSMNWLGRTSEVTTDAAGETRYGAFGSIDSAPILLGLDYGILPLLVLLGAAVVAAVALVRANRSAALVAVVALLPGLTSVAFITQLTPMFWFVVGLAVAHVDVLAGRDPASDVAAGARNDPRAVDRLVAAGGSIAAGR
ncbi:hypothetical protein [Cellulomonas composti]|uniref:Uncharacterized protein n=1 Tax=Cellulomonas composti TaxID=266130 RepID=A0A511JAE3_9CELL|nr:hypothetical protein [Cellulomonas composti]GEL94962.1 hypothetical protein CCO02nite_16200 [Cellulomonas composti]